MDFALFCSVSGYEDIIEEVFVIMFCERACLRDLNCIVESEIKTNTGIPIRTFLDVFKKKRFKFIYVHSNEKFKTYRRKEFKEQRINYHLQPQKI